MFYWVKTPGLLRSIFKSCIWKLEPAEPTIYLTFDDGPHDKATPFVLQQLRHYHAKATFFCIGKNVVAHPDIYQEIFINEHSIGNHTQNHLNGWKTDTVTYIENILEAKKYINSPLFRPPYGKITPFQISALRTKIPDIKIIMWDVLSADFDITISPQDCLQNVLFKATSGSIIVFHDSQKAWDRLEYALPRVLEHYTKNGFKLAALPV